MSDEGLAEKVAKLEEQMSVARYLLARLVPEVVDYGGYRHRRTAREKFGDDVVNAFFRDDP